MTVIVTGFGPFAKQEYNPTKALLKTLDKTVEGITIIPIELPVIYDECFTVLEDAINEYSPKMIIMLGVAASRDKINLERVAINLKDADIPDNLGIIFQDKPIIEHGDTAYFTTLDIKRLKDILIKNNIPAKISNTAGTYVCNNIFYLTMHYLEKQRLNIPAGFIHVPEMIGSTQEETLNIYNDMIETIITATMKKEG